MTSGKEPTVHDLDAAYQLGYADGVASVTAPSTPFDEARTYIKANAATLTLADAYTYLQNFDLNRADKELLANIVRHAQSVRETFTEQQEPLRTRTARDRVKVTTGDITLN